MFLKNKITIKWYIIADTISVILSWLIFYGLRKFFLNEEINHLNWLKDKTLLNGLIVISIFWIVFFYIAAFYTELYIKSRLFETIKTIFVIALGSLILFFLILIDDNATNYNYYFRSFLLLWLITSIIVLLGRITILTICKYQLNKNLFYYPSLNIGTTQSNIAYNTLQQQVQKWTPFKTVAALEWNNNSEEINEVIKKNKIKEVVITNQYSDTVTKEILSNLLGNGIHIKINATEQDFVYGAVKTNNIFTNGFIQLQNTAMPAWQQNVKNILDKIFAIFCMITLLPLLLFIWIRTYVDSKGKAIYKQQRLGKNAKPFTLFKFTSMLHNAEISGPQLSSDNDNRITKWGKTMRKWRLDELPQLFNIVKGNMSFVGPRPEREFFAKQLIAKNTYYKLLYESKPGLTSWGMVKYGYAENIEQMLVRMQYDLLYANNASLLIDVKIMLHTLRIVLLGKGK